MDSSKPYANGKNGERESVEFPPELERIYREEREHLINHVFASTRDMSDAEEIVSEAFRRAYSSWDRFRGECAPRTWVYRIAANLAKNRYWYWQRRNSRYNSSSFESGGYDLVDRSSPADNAELSEFSERVAGAIDGLDQNHREIFIMRFVQNLSYDEIAEILGLELGTVKSRLARARDKLRNLLKTGKEMDDSEEISRRAQLETILAPKETHWEQFG